MVHRLLCDSNTTSFRVPEHKLQKSHAFIHAVMEHGSLTVQTSEIVAGKSVSMSIAIRPASLCTRYVFEAIAKTNGRAIQLNSKHDMCAGVSIWRRLPATLQEGPWYEPRHYASQATVSASDASSNQWGGVVSMTAGEFFVGGGFLTSGYLGTSPEVLTACSRAHSGHLRRAWLLMDIDSCAGMNTFKMGRSKNTCTRGLLVGLFELQEDQGFWLPLLWVSTADIQSSGAITRLGRAEIIRFSTDSVSTLMGVLRGAYHGLMASSENAR